MQKIYLSKLVLAAAVAASLYPFIQSAKADEEVVETRRTTTIESPLPAYDSTTTTTTTTERSVVIPSSGSVVVSPVPEVVTTTTIVPLSLNDAHVILQTIDLRRDKIDRTIVEARSGGYLSEAQAAGLRKELDRIGAEIAYLKAQPTPSISRSISLAQDLDALAFQVKAVYGNVTFIPIIEGSHFTIFNGRIVQLDELSVRRVGLENKILQRLSEGRISWQQSNDLRLDLSEIAAREDAYRSARLSGKLSDREAREIYNAFDRVADRLDTYSHMR